MNRSATVALVLLAGTTFNGCACCWVKKDTNDSRAMMETTTHVESSPRISGMRNVYFAYDSSELSTISKSTLRDNAEWLAMPGNRNVDVVIDGHADERGTDAYNIALGKRRADAAASYLKTLGIETRRVSTVSYGERDPADSRHNEQAWAENRRVMFDALGFTR